MFKNTRGLTIKPIYPWTDYSSEWKFFNNRIKRCEFSYFPHHLCFQDINNKIHMFQLENYTHKNSNLCQFIEFLWKEKNKGPQINKNFYGYHFSLYKEFFIKLDLFTDMFKAIGNNNLEKYRYLHFMYELDLSLRHNTFNINKSEYIEIKDNQEKMTKNNGFK